MQVEGQMELEEKPEQQEQGETESASSSYLEIPPCECPFVKCYLYDWANDSWTKAATLLRSRESVALVSSDGKAYAIGGTNIPNHLWLDGCDTDNRYSEFSVLCSIVTTPLVLMKNALSMIQRSTSGLRSSPCLYLELELGAVLLLFLCFCVGNADVCSGCGSEIVCDGRTDWRFVPRSYCQRGRDLWHWDWTVESCRRHVWSQGILHSAVFPSVVSEIIWVRETLFFASAVDDRNHREATPIVFKCKSSDNMQLLLDPCAVFDLLQWLVGCFYSQHLKWIVEEKSFSNLDKRRRGEKEPNNGCQPQLILKTSLFSPRPTSATSAVCKRFWCFGICQQIFCRGDFIEDRCAHSSADTR